MSNPIPHGSALARLVAGEPINNLENKRNELRALMVEYETELDAAEQREARVKERRERTAKATINRIGGGGR